MESLTCLRTISSDADENIVVPENLFVLFVDEHRTVKYAAPSGTISNAASGKVASQMVETPNFDFIFMGMYWRARKADVRMRSRVKKF